MLTASTNYALIGAGALSSVVAAHLLGPSGRGVLAAIQLWPMTLGSLAVMGMPEAIVFYCRGGKDDGALLSSAVVVAFLGCAIAAGAGYVLMPALLDAHEDATVHASRVFLLMTILTGLSVPLHLLRARGEFGQWNAYRILGPLSWLVILGVAAFRGGAQPATLAYVWLAVTALLVVMIAGLVGSRAPGWGRPRAVLARRLVAFGAPGALSVLPQTLSLRLDQILMAGFLPPRDLGLYVTAVGWSALVMPALSAVGAVAFPSVRNASGQAQRDLVGVVSRSAVLVSVVLAVGAATTTPIVLPLLYGHDFVEAVKPALVLVLASGVLGVGQVLQDVFRGLGRPTVVLVSELVGVTATLMALALLLRPLGIMGAAWASLAGYAATTVCLVMAMKRSTSQPVSALVTPGKSDAARLVNMVLGRFRA